MEDNKFIFNASNAAILALGATTRCRDKIEEIYESLQTNAEKEV